VNSIYYQLNYKVFRLLEETLTINTELQVFNNLFLKVIYFWIRTNWLYLTSTNPYGREGVDVMYLKTILKKMSDCSTWGLLFCGFWLSYLKRTQICTQTKHLAQIVESPPVTSLWLQICSASTYNWLQGNFIKLCRILACFQTIHWSRFLTDVSW
jgi:hypothetical protein